MKTIIWPVLVLGLVLSLGGCVAPSQLYVGKSVSAEHVISLAPGVDQSGTWSTFDVELAYRSLLQGDLLELAVQGGLSQHYEIMYTRVNLFFLELYLLDGQNKVLETVFLPTSALMRTDDTFQTQRTLQVPAGTRGISFGYRGVASELEDSTSFDFRPMMKN